MASITFPPQLAGVAGALRDNPAGAAADVDAIRAAIGNGMGFAPGLPVMLASWARRAHVATDGARICIIALTGFALPVPDRVRAVRRAIVEIRRAAAAVKAGTEPRAIYADDRAGGLLVFGDDRPRQRPEADWGWDASPHGNRPVTFTPAGESRRVTATPISGPRAGQLGHGGRA